MHQQFYDSLRIKGEILLRWILFFPNMDLNVL